MAVRTYPVPAGQLQPQGTLAERPGSYYKAPSSMRYLGTGMGVSPLYHRHQISENVVEYDEVGYDYDERYSSPVLEIPETIYDYVIHPITTGTLFTGKAIIGGTGAVVGAGVIGASYVVRGGYNGVSYVAETAYDGVKYVGNHLHYHSGKVIDHVGDGLDYAGRGLQNAGDVVPYVGDEEYHAGPSNEHYYQGRRIIHTGPLAPGNSHPLASGKVVQSTTSQFATAKAMAGAGAQEVDKVDAFGRVVERDLIMQRGGVTEIDKYDAAGNIIERDFVVAQPPPPPRQTLTEIDKIDASGRIVERDFVVTGSPAPVVSPVARTSNVIEVDKVDASGHIVERDFIVTGAPTTVAHAPAVYNTEVVTSPPGSVSVLRAAPTRIGTKVIN